MNILIALAGWFAWNAIIFRIDKDQYDERGESFNLKQYALQSYDNWIASAAMIPVLLYLGYKGLGIPGAFLSIDVDKLEWSDIYYLCSGFATEAVIFAIKKWKASRK
jgi:hypothetical protein